MPNITDYALHLVNGHVRHADGILGRRTQFPVYVSPDGAAYAADGGFEVECSAWNDGNVMEWGAAGFAPDDGEFERCGISFSNHCRAA